MPEAQQLNRARLANLDSLGLPIQGRTVLDVGCGVGHLAGFFIDRGCRVVCVDGRTENIERLRFLYPGLEAHVANVESDSLSAFGRFDIVFCYGLLYHLEDPMAGLRNIASICDETLLLESIITDHQDPILRAVDDYPRNPNQALRAVGCRPSPAYVGFALTRAGLPFVYMPKCPPEHPDFRFEWKGDLAWEREGHLLRAIFVASRSPLAIPSLTSLLAAPGLALAQP